MRGDSQELWFSASTILVLVELQRQWFRKEKAMQSKSELTLSAICGAYLRFPQKFWVQLGTVAHRCKPSTWEVGIKGS